MPADTRAKQERVRCVGGRVWMEGTAGGTAKGGEEWVALRLCVVD